MKKTVTKQPAPIGIIILAAGASRRMGTPKQLLKIGKQTLIERAIEVAQAVTNSKTVVVLGANAEKIKNSIQQNDTISIIINKNWYKGMGTTLQAGLPFLMKKEKQLAAVIIMVCDQPYLTREVLEELINTYQKTKVDIVAARYQGILGVPALFSKKMFSKLAQLNEEEGARKIIKRYKGKVGIIDFPAGIIDLDTPEEYQATITRLRQSKIIN